MRSRVSQSETPKPVGVVVIGRNEGQHLKACLMSVCGEGGQIVYVDSGSTDKSVSIANKIGVDVIELESMRVFTAARARNEGMQHLKTVAPECDLVQFVDGDCVVEPGWVNAAQKFLLENPDVTIVCGRLRERYPERTVFNYLCDLEWGGSAGEINACGGIFMMRMRMFHELGGFREDLRAGEEPELCLRVRQSGGKVWRLEMDMALHDADIHRILDWWRRARRGGYAYAEISSLHKASANRIWQRETRRALVWGALLPFAIAITALWNIKAVLLLGIYPLQLIRIACNNNSNISRPWLFAVFMLLSKFAETSGIVCFYRDRFMGGAIDKKPLNRQSVDS